MVKLAEVCDIQMGSAPKGSSYTELSEGIPLVAGASDYGELYPLPKKATTEPTQVCQTGDLIICVRATIGDLNWADKPYCLGRGVAGLRSKAQLDSNYLFYFIRANEHVLYDNSTGSTFPQINKKTIENLLVPLPPVAVQKSIAEKLKKAEMLVKSSLQMESELNILAQAVFLEMFGDPLINSKGWNTKKLRDLGELNRGKSKHRPRNDPILLGGPYPLIQTGDIARADNYIVNYKSTYSAFGLKQSKLWPKGTLCITIAANIADTAILSFEACFPDSVVGFNADVNLTSNEFIHYWLKFYQSTLEQLAPESAQKNINLKILEEIDVFVPPLTHQLQFVAILNAVEKRKKEVRRQNEYLHECFDALMQRAFFGKLDLKKVA
ncbi:MULTISPECIES: restriction endonuclease subunit S [unclassified Pantoea]